LFDVHFLCVLIIYWHSVPLNGLNFTDFVFRGNAEPGYECKHVSAVLKYLGRRYLAEYYDPQHQHPHAA
jgi:hypothetical protein